MVKKWPAKAGDAKDGSSLGQDSLEKGMGTFPVFLPKKSHGQKSLVGYSPGHHKELDVTERLSTHSIS